jgi:xyloglucan-specific exo-beta-1,4-glucanase
MNENKMNDNKMNDIRMNDNEMKDKIEYVSYDYKNAPIPGGGFVTGLCFHPKEKEILYARTDIGGVYRYNFTSKTWISLMDHVIHINKWESYPLSIALDSNEPDWIYIAAGDWKQNFICRSKDRGEHFEYFPLPAGVHGNAPGRGTGERLAVDPCNSSILYYGSQSDGLLRSEDYGETWEKLPVKPMDGNEELDIAFVCLDPMSERNNRCHTIIVSTSGKENSPGDNVRGGSLYLSKDAGNSFYLLPGQPAISYYGNYPGFVGQRAAFSGRFLYITMSAIRYSWAGWHGYACDSGGEQQGCIIRYELTKHGELLNWKYITPDLTFLVGKEDTIYDITGFGGISTDRNLPGHILCTTQCCKNGDIIFYSQDYGDHWIPVLHGLTIGRMDFGEVPYMKPEYNNNGNLIHWLSDIKIDPFDSNRAVFNTGTGIFMTENLLDCKNGSSVVWKPFCKGIEETVHLNVYSPPGGEVQLIDIVGDLGGFAFTDLTRPAENSFADEKDNRYITCLNADFPDSNPMLVAVTARGNWSGNTTGGLIWSEDQCKTWNRLPDPTSISLRIDTLINEIHKPNKNSGWTAVSADAKTLVWCVGEKSRLPMDAVVYTEDLGVKWVKSKVFDLNKMKLEDSFLTMKVISDRMDPELFYGFGKDSAMFISIDRARTFYQVPVPKEFPKLELGGMDGTMPAEIRAESGKTGVIWIATGEEGLWKIIIEKESQSAEFQRITKEGDSVYRQGMGKPAPESNYHTLYINGCINGEYGFYRSFDEGRTWQRINHNKQMFGDIRSIAGDPRTFGRFYIATGSRGVLWGQPSPSENTTTN